MPEDAPPLLGLVLAGGRSRRMGRDKGGLEMGGATQAERALTLLAPFCADSRVSVRASQAEDEPYRRLPLVFDDDSLAGPVAGLVAAWSEFPAAALLVLAVDMPRVDADLIGQLVSGRDPSKLATAFRHGSGPIEPLCAIWEPRAAVQLHEIIEKTGGASPRRLLESADVCILTPPDPAKLASANTPEAQRKLGGTVGGC